MPKDFKLSSPLDASAELRKAVREGRQADHLVENAVMRAFEVFRTLKFGKFSGPGLLKVIDRLDRATEQLGDARTALADAVYQIDQVLKETEH